MATESLTRFQRIDRCDELLVEAATLADLIRCATTGNNTGTEPGSETVPMACVMMKQKFRELDEHLSALK